ncbi:unnamed protein product, partial [Mesorhabditis spiculigera]
VLTDNCKRCKKSPHILRDQPIADTTVDEAQIVGHTVLLEANDEVLACATVIVPEYRLLHASFHRDPVHGHIHIVPMEGRMRVLPDLRYNTDYEASDPRAEVLDWAFVQDCESNNVEQSSEGTELGVDSRMTLTLDTSGANVTLRNFALFRGGQPFACSPLVDVEPRTIQADDVHFVQEHIYSATRFSGPASQSPSEVHVRDDCLDVSTESIHRPLPSSNPAFFPSISIFGPDSMMLKSLVPHPAEAPRQCTVLRPRFARPAATASFAHPIVGELVLVDTDDRIAVTGALRHLFDEESSRATIQVSPRFAEPAGCPQYLSGCSDCFSLQDSALIAGKADSEDLTLSGTLPHFNLSAMRSVIVDLTWTKVCANLTQLPNGAIEARATVRRYSPVTAMAVATVVLMEYPANNYTEAVINKKTAIGEVSVHERPVDMAVTGGPPCGEMTVGPVKTVPWLSNLQDALEGDENDTTIIIDDRLISGRHSALGLSLLLGDAEHNQSVYCGHFGISAGPSTIRVAMFNTTIDGYLRLEQSPSEVSPVLLSYQIHDNNSTAELGGKESPIEWSIVTETEGQSCQSALLFNPAQLNDTECNSTGEWLCPLGHRLEALHPDRRGWQPLRRLSLGGPFSVDGQSIRLNTSQGVVCAPLVEMNRASIRIKALSTRSLSEVQKKLGEKLHLRQFQIQIDYNRELAGSHCAIYRVTLLAPSDQIAEMLDGLDEATMQFKQDKPLECGKEATGAPATVTTAPTRSSSTLRISTSFLIVLASFWLLR